LINRTAIPQVAGHGYCLKQSASGGKPCTTNFLVKLPTTSYEPQATSYKPQATNYWSLVAGGWLLVAGK